MENRELPQKLNDNFEVIDTLVKIKHVKKDIDKLKKYYNISTLEAILDNYFDKLKSKFNINDAMIDEYKNFIDNSTNVEIESINNNYKNQLIQKEAEIDSLKNDIEFYQIIIENYESKNQSLEDELLNTVSIERFKEIENQLNECKNFKYNIDVTNLNDSIDNIKNITESNVLRIKKDVDNIRNSLGNFNKNELEQLGLYDLYLLTNEIVNEMTAYEFVATNLESLLSNIEVLDNKIDELKQLKESNELLQQSIGHSETIEDIKNILEEQSQEENVIDSEIEEQQEIDNNNFLENNNIDTTDGTFEVKKIDPKDIYGDEELEEEKVSFFKKLFSKKNNKKDNYDIINENEYIDNSDINEDIIESEEDEMSLKSDYKEAKSGTIKLVVTIIIVAILTASIVISYKLGYLDNMIDQVKNNQLINEFIEKFKNLIS